MNFERKTFSWFRDLGMCRAGPGQGKPDAKNPAQARPGPTKYPPSPLGRGPDRSVKLCFWATQAWSGPTVGPTFLGPCPSFSGRASCRAAHSQVCHSQW
jgi:hypothetical protein